MIASHAPQRTYAELRLSRKTIAPALRIAEIRQGYSPELVTEISKELDLTKNEVLEVIGVPHTTLTRLVRSHRPLDQSASERLDRLATIEGEAAEVFGNREEAVQWLKTRNLALGDETPLSLLDTETGALQVRRVLAALRFGGVV